MATEHLNGGSEALLRDFVMGLLRQNTPMTEIITALQVIKVEMLAVTRYQDAINDADQRP